MTRWTWLVALALLFCLAATTQAQQPTINTVAGGGLPTPGAATATGITSLGGIGRDSSGNFYFSSNAGVILKMDTSGNLSVIAGTGTCCFSGDGGPASSAQTTIQTFVPASPVKVDPAGNVFYGDTGECVVREINAATGIITTVAGTPSFSVGASGTVCRYGGDGGPATSAQLTPSWLGFDSAGNLYISDGSVCVVRRVDHATQIITTVAGNAALGCAFPSLPGPAIGDGGPATSAQLYSPEGLVIDSSGNLFIADVSEVRRVDASTHVITAYAGSGSTFPPTGVVATQADLCCFLSGLALDPSGNLLVALAETSPPSGGIVSPLILSVNRSTQVISVVGGSTTLAPGFFGDGGPATSAQFAYTAWYLGALDFVVDPAGNIFVADTGNYRVREISATTGNISTVAGNGTVKDGGPALGAILFANGFAIDSSGNLLVSDGQNSRIRRVDHTTQQISTVVGTDVGPLTPPSGDGGPATSAQLFFPRTVISDGTGDLFIADNSGNKVREVAAATGAINTYAGGANCGVVAGRPRTFCGDGGPATSAGLNAVQSLAIDAGGNLVIADTFNNVVRSVNASTHVITTVAGNTAVVNAQGTPVAGYSGDGGPATSAQLNQPYGIAFDAAGNLYIADSGNNVIRRVSAATQTITTVAGNFSQGGGMGGDGGPATAASLSSPEAVAFDAFGNLYVADTNNFRVRVVNSVTGIITTLAGNGFPNFAGDSGPAAAAGLWPVHGNGIVIAPGSGGNILVYVQDEFSGRARVVTIPPVPAAVLRPGVGLSFQTQQTGTTSAAQPVVILNSGTGTLNVSNVSFTGTNPGDFTIVPGGTCTGTSFAVAPTASCTVMVALAPTTTGMLTALLTFTDNAAGGTQSLMLTGSGSAAPPPNPPSALIATPAPTLVALTWTASSTAGVSYDVYRRLRSGGGCPAPSAATYTLIASSVAGTNYPDADPSLMAGNTYCYAVTAVAAGAQSAFSNVASITLAAGFVPTLTITLTTLPNGAVGVPYGADIQFAGGTGPYTFAVTSGALPAGFSMTTTQSGNVNAGHVYSTTSPPATAGPFMFGVTVTDSTSPTPQMATTMISLTIGAAPANTQASLLKGQYALLVQPFSDASGDEQGVVGSVNFDGVGSFTGVIDVNGVSAITQDAAVTGTYSIGPDNRGFLTLTETGMANSVTLVFAVGSVYRGVAYEARLTQFNDNDGNHRIASGFLKLQEPTAFNQNSFAGSYAFGLTGQTPSLTRAAEVGLVSFDNALNVNSGAADINEAGTLTSITFSGTYTAPDPNGRSVISATVMPSGAFTTVVYVISTGEAVVMTLNPRANNDLFIGSALRQANPGTFTNSSLAGPDVFYFSALGSGGGGSEAVVGLATASGSTLTINYDDNSHGNLSLNGNIGFDYSVASNGRVVATSGNAELICYLARQDRGYCLIPDSSAGAGELLPQSGAPFSASPFPGNVFFGVSETVEAHEAISGIGVLASPGTLNLSIDDSHAGGRLDYGATASFNFSVASNGHFTGIRNTQIGGTSGYLISPYELAFLDTSQSSSGQGSGSSHPHVFLGQTLTAPPGTPSPAGTSVTFPTPIAQGSGGAFGPVIFTNTGLGPMAFTGVNTTASPDFNAQGAGAGGCLPAAGVFVLLPGASCTITVTFNPTISTPTGTVLNETLVLTTDGTTNVTIAVSGTATAISAAVTFTPTAAVGVNFGAVVPGMTSAVFTETLAVAAGMLQLTSVTIVPTGTGTGPTDFAIAPGTTCPAGGGAVTTSCVVNLTFTPSLVGNESANLVIAGTNLTGSPVAIPLTGVGASTAAGFTFTVQPTAGGGSGAVVTLTPGESAIFPLILTPNPGFVGTITVACGTITPPTNTTLCTVGTPTVNITTSPSAPVTVFLKFQTNCAVSMQAPRGPGSQPVVPAAPVSAVLVLAMLVAMRWRRGNPPRRARGWVQQLVPVLGMALLVLLLMTWTACVKDPPPAIPNAPTTPAGTYTLPVTATAPGGVVRTLTLTINVT